MEGSNFSDPSFSGFFDSGGVVNRVDPEGVGHSHISTSGLDDPNGYWREQDPLSSSNDFDGPPTDSHPDTTTTFQQSYSNDWNDYYVASQVAPVDAAPEYPSGPSTSTSTSTFDLYPNPEFTSSLPSYPVPEEEQREDYQPPAIGQSDSYDISLPTYTNLESTSGLASSSSTTYSDYNVANNSALLSQISYSDTGYGTSTSSAHVPVTEANFDTPDAHRPYLSSEGASQPNWNHNTDRTTYPYAETSSTPRFDHPPYNVPIGLPEALRASTFPRPSPTPRLPPPQPDMSFSMPASRVSLRGWNYNTGGATYPYAETSSTPSSSHTPYEFPTGLPAATSASTFPNSSPAPRLPPFQMQFQMPLQPGGDLYSNTHQATYPTAGPSSSSTRLFGNQSLYLSRYPSGAATANIPIPSPARRSPVPPPRMPYLMPPPEVTAPPTRNSRKRKAKEAVAPNTRAPRARESKGKRQARGKGTSKQQMPAIIDEDEHRKKRRQTTILPPVDSEHIINSIYDEKLRQELIAKYVKNNYFSEEGFAEVNRRFVYDISKVNPETGKRTNIPSHCQVCHRFRGNFRGDNFIFKTTINAHVNTVCGHLSAVQTYLGGHYDKTIEEIKPHECGYRNAGCAYRTSRDSDLGTHMSTCPYKNGTTRPALSEPLEPSCQSETTSSDASMPVASSSSTITTSATPVAGTSSTPPALVASGSLSVSATIVPTASGSSARTTSPVPVASGPSTSSAPAASSTSTPPAPVASGSSSASTAIALAASESSTTPSTSIPSLSPASAAISGSEESSPETPPELLTSLPPLPSPRKKERQALTRDPSLATGLGRMGL